MNKISVIDLYPIEMKLNSKTVNFTDDNSCLKYLHDTNYSPNRKAARQEINSILNKNNHYKEWLELSKSEKLTADKMEILKKYKNKANSFEKGDLDCVFKQIEAILPKKQVLYHCGKLDEERNYLSTTLNIAYAFQTFINKNYCPIYIITIKSENIKFYCFNDLNETYNNESFPEGEVLIQCGKINDSLNQKNGEEISSGNIPSLYLFKIEL